jgi:RNA polymerase sigma-70 factor (ECF subfamily)
MGSRQEGREANRQAEIYGEAAAAYGAPLDRLARAYEADPEERRDLLQEIHLALWRSFAGFDGRCSLRTWVYRVAHNVAASHVLKRRRRARLITLEDVEAESAPAAPREHDLQIVLTLMQRLNPPDRQLLLLYLEGMEAAEIAEIMGLSAGNVATRIHRVKNILARHYQEGGRLGH